MRGVNKVIIVGTLGNDPQMKQFQNGGLVASVSVATSEFWTDKNTGERQEKTEWHRVVFNGKLAELAQQYLHKGSKLYVEGKLQTRKYNDNGVEKVITEIIALSMTMVDSPNRQQAPQQGNYQQQAQPQYTQNGYPLNNGFAQNHPNDDDLPF